MPCARKYIGIRAKGVGKPKRALLKVKGGGLKGRKTKIGLLKKYKKK